MTAIESDFDGRHFRNALGRFPTGMTIVTALTPDGHPVGLTANSFNAVSLTPPLVLWSLSMRTNSLAIYRAAKHYAINVLAADQSELSSRFGKRAEGLYEDRYAGVTYRGGADGAPLLEGCCAWFECANRSQYEEGDHVIFVGEVVGCGYAEREPLAFHAGAYCLTRSLVAEPA